MEVRWDIRQLLDGEGQKPASGSRPSLLAVNARRRELDQALEVPAVGAGRAEPDGFPLFMGFEESPVSKCGETSRDALLVRQLGNSQAFGSAERIRSIWATST